MQITMFNDLLSKEVSRKEFLMYLGALLLAITGVSALLKTISDPNLLSSARPKSGFGKGPYGG